jgi:hypothetical protein
MIEGTIKVAIAPLEPAAGSRSAPWRTVCFTDGVWDTESALWKFVLGVKKCFTWPKEWLGESPRGSRSLSTSTRGRLRKIRLAKRKGR